MVVPAGRDLVPMFGALNGYVLTKWRFKGDTILFGLLLFSCFIPFQIVLIPMARMVLGQARHLGDSVHGAHPCARGLRHRLHHALLP